MRGGASPFESKKSQIKLVIEIYSPLTLISIHGKSHMNNYLDDRNRTRKKSHGNVCVILSSEIFKVVCITNKKLTRFLLLTVNISSWGLVSTLNSIVSLQDHPRCFKSLFRTNNGRFLSYSRKRKISQHSHSLSLVVIHCHSLSFVVTRCHSLSLVVICCHSVFLVVPLVVTRCTTCCHSLYHSLSFVVTRCHSLSFDVSLVCLFINDL